MRSISRARPRQARRPPYEKTIGDPAAQKLVEWFILRHPDADANFSRYAAFIADNPDWPSMGLMRRRAEARLWQERSDAATVRNFIGDQPTSAKGRFALARVLLAEGDRDGAGRLVREAWRSEELSERSEAEAFELFRDLLTREDHRARMDKRIGAKDIAGAKRAAQRLGSDELSIVKACAAGEHGQGARFARRRLRPRPAAISDIHCAVSTGWCVTTGSTTQPA